jgi:hypothetical protein
MSRVFVNGLGAVSPAGWGITALRDAVAKGTALPTKALTRPGWEKPLAIRQVPPANPRPAFLAHPRLRRTSPISQYVVGAALEALGADAGLVSEGKLRLGLILCVMCGCVNYSRRFYDEALREPATASPLVFPETVFNAPASHIATLLGTPAINYTLVGDPGTYLQGVALAAQWLAADTVDACIVVGAEECDWLSSDAFHLFSKQLVLTDGAGALYLRREISSSTLAELKSITDPQLFHSAKERAAAVRQVRDQFPSPAGKPILCDSLLNVSRLDDAEKAAWHDWSAPRLSPKSILGEGLLAASGWQCVVAIDAIAQGSYTDAIVNIVGCNQQAIAAQFARVEPAAQTHI